MSRSLILQCQNLYHNSQFIRSMSFAAEIFKVPLICSIGEYIKYEKLCSDYNLKDQNVSTFYQCNHVVDTKYTIS